MADKIDLPDFEDMFKIIDEIRNNSLEKAELEHQVRLAESEIIKKVTTDKSYFKGDKPPAKNFIDGTYLFTGLDNELLPFREKIAQLSINIEYLKSKLSLLRDTIEVWRTQSANERTSVM